MKLCYVAISLSLALAAFQGATDKKQKEEPNMFATKWQMSHGGIGIINKNLFVGVKYSPEDRRNEIIIKPTEETEQRWHGKSDPQTEVVTVYDNKIWSSNDNLPSDFDLSKAVVISFEKDKIRFFDFQKMSGGYYDKIK